MCCKCRHTKPSPALKGQKNSLLMQNLQGYWNPGNWAIVGACNARRIRKVSFLFFFFKKQPHTFNCASSNRKRQIQAKELGGGEPKSRICRQHTSTGCLQSVLGERDRHIHPSKLICTHTKSIVKGAQMYK